MTQIPGGSMMFYAKNVTSQNGEDGIIAELIRRLHLNKHLGSFVEFGTGNGRDLSNTYSLTERGWKGVWIEQNEDSYYKSKGVAELFGNRVQAIHGSVGFGAEDSLDAFLDRSHLSHKDVIEVLSIDIDSFDLQVWEAFLRRRAIIVIIEINSGVPLGVEQIHANGGPQGASFTSMLALGKKKGYTLVAHTGNLIFVADEYADRVGLPAHELLDPNCIFNTMWSRWATEAAK